MQGGKTNAYLITKKTDFFSKTFYTKLANLFSLVLYHHWVKGLCRFIFPCNICHIFHDQNAIASLLWEEIVPALMLWSFILLGFYQTASVTVHWSLDPSRSILGFSVFLCVYVFNLRVLRPVWQLSSTTTFPMWIFIMQLFFIFTQLIRHSLSFDMDVKCIIKHLNSSHHHFIKSLSYNREWVNSRIN